MTESEDESTIPIRITSKSTPELLALVGDVASWRPFARALAEAELKERGIAQGAIEAVKAEWAVRAAAEKEAHAADMKRRPHESYTLQEAALILFTWPTLVVLELVTHGLFESTGKGLWTLSGEKRWLKFRQRCVLIPASIALYAFVFSLIFD